MISWVALALSAALAATPKASSEQENSEGEKYAAALAFDGLLGTSWAEAETGDGDGAWLDLQFDRPVDVESVSIFPGFLAGSKRTIREYGRPKNVTLILEGRGREPIEQAVRLLDPSADGPMRHDVYVSAPGTTKIRIRIDNSFGGGIKSDTHIAEVAVNLVRGDATAALKPMADYLASSRGQRLVEEAAEQVATWEKNVTEAEFGDRPSFLSLLDWAADGPVPLRSQLSRTTAPGFRVAALPPDLGALEALLRIKDANAIDAILRASARTIGPLSKDLEKRAQMFSAYQDLIGGANRQMPAWGDTGIAKGGLQGLGEPLDLAVDGFGGVYVADIGNHRVQRFGISTGTFEEQWGGGEPAMTDKWFGRGRAHYASGKTPGANDGWFISPVDLALIRNKKEGDAILVLDTSARVTKIGPDGKVAGVFTISPDGGLGAGVGGEGHVLYAKGEIVVIWSNEGFRLDAETGEELGRFKLKRAPNSAAALKSGKLVLAIGDQLVMYSTDGFRHGDVMNGALGEGFQDWAVTVDEKGKLWAVTDRGDVTKFKAPGKAQYTISVADYSLEVPRIAVFDDLVFVTNGDKIIKVDALEASKPGDPE